MARAVLMFLGEQSTSQGPPDYAGGQLRRAKQSTTGSSEAIYELVAERQKMMKDAWLTAAKHQRPGMEQGIPLAEAQAKYKEIEKKIDALLK